MNWIPILIVAAFVMVVLILKQAGQVSAATARGLLAKGALVVDVRSPGEFASCNLPQAMNIPLGEIEAVVSGRVKDRTQPLLLYCASGTRSGLAKRKLASLGFTNVFNLGSYGRAEAVLSGK